ncbi:WD repeat-containing protein 76-like [Panulirus ornatus]|uniref:WD repeat-containing protein 76-like n=1 Tax=Panulirus ornatus TaxID=150431 RepID=UPI003A841147
MMLPSNDGEPLQKRVKMMGPESDERTVKNTQNNNSSAHVANGDRISTRSSVATGSSRITTEGACKVKKEKDFDPCLIKMEEELAPDFVGLSDYERMIQQNIAEKKKLLDSLEILKVKDELIAMKPQPVKKATYRGIAKEQKSDELCKSEVIKGSKGPASLIDYYKPQNREECEMFIRDIQAMPVCGEESSVWRGNFSRVLQRMKKMKISTELVAKVVPERTFAAQIHPSLDKILVLVGSKWGELGIWDVQRKDKTSGAYYFNPHSGPINCLTIDKWNPQHIFSSSYDGSLRRTDLTAGIVQEVHCYSKEDFHNMYLWHAHLDKNSILVGTNHGKVIHVDTRADEKNPKEYKVQNSNIKVVTVHPTRTQYFATASSCGHVCLWDIRKHKTNDPLTFCRHSKSISGLEFSPVTGKSMISTCMDNYLRFISFNLVDLKVTQKISHCTQTGRWLTTFKARYVPRREDLVVVGSLKQPRRIQVWGADGQLQHEFTGESFASVSSITAMHPTRAILVGTNSSGKAHVFK